MPHHSRAAILLRVVGLPLLLVLGVVGGLGSYCETSDDATLAGLFSGAFALRPVPSGPLYLHGYGHGLAAAYAAAPGVPWLGLLLGGLLLGATGLFFAVLDRLLRPWLRPGPLALALLVLFEIGWLEHWLWFSHARVALLLAGAGTLYAAQRPGRRGALLLGLAALGAAWLVRPGLAGLGFGAALPAAWWLAGSARRAAPVLLSAAMGLVGAFGLAALLRTPAEARFQRLDAGLARVLDYEQLRPVPRTAADSLGTAAVGLWLFGDSALVNEGLIGRAYHFDVADFGRYTVPAKLRLRAGQVLRDYFPLLLALAATAVAARRRRGFWLVQLGFGGVLLLLAGVLKLPPRLALPLLDFWLLAGLAAWLPAGINSRGEAAPVGYWPKLSPLLRIAGAGLAGAVLLLYGAKTWHRRQVLGPEQGRHELALQHIRQQGSGAIRVLAGTDDFLKSLSPFRAWSLGPGPVLLLSGWASHDAAQARLRQATGGTADQAECLRRLALLPAPGPQQPVVWVLDSGAAAWLNRRFRGEAAGVRLRPGAGPGPFGAGSPVRVYHAQAGPER